MEEEKKQKENIEDLRNSKPKTIPFIFDSQTNSIFCGACGNNRNYIIFALSDMKVKAINLFLRCPICQAEGVLQMIHADEDDDDLKKKDQDIFIID